MRRSSLERVNLFRQVLPLPSADGIIGLVAQFIQILYFAAVPELKHAVFVPDAAGLEKFFRSLKSRGCPFCELMGALNRHSRMYGNDPEANAGRCTRGQRVFCSDRGQQRGCGRTFPVLFAWVLPRHSFTATLLWQAVQQWLGGLSRKASWQTVTTPLALDSFYHLLQRLRRRLTPLRTVLAASHRPPNSRHADPLLQTFEHLQVVFPKVTCPLETFQQHFQRPWTG